VPTSPWPLLLSLIVALAAPAEGAAPPSADQMLATLAARHAAPRSFTASIKADFRERSFPFMRVHLDGDAFYRAPDRYAVAFRNAPSYMKGFEQGYAAMMDTGAWPRQFTASPLPDRVRGGRIQHALRLTAIDPKAPLHHSDVFVDAPTGDIVEMDWQFVNGMTFTIDQGFEQMPTGEHVVAVQYATFHVPFAWGNATFHLSNYRCNVALSDAVFTSLDR
jgi:hypothetical protein